MMKGKFVLFSTVLLVSLFAGCDNPPESPISTIPKILIDHIEETEEIKVFVHGIDDHLFSNISIQIDEVRITENFTYELHASTLQENFELMVSVWDKQKHYEYSSNITVFEDDDEIKMEVLGTDNNEPTEKSFPYTIIMERKE